MLDPVGDVQFDLDLVAGDVADALAVGVLGQDDSEVGAAALGHRLGNLDDVAGERVAVAPAVVGELDGADGVGRQHEQLGAELGERGVRGPVVEDEDDAVAVRGHCGCDSLGWCVD